MDQHGTQAESLADVIPLTPREPAAVAPVLGAVVPEPPPAPERHGSRSAAAWQDLAGPVFAGLMAAFLTTGDGTSFESGFVVALVYGGAAQIPRRRGGHTVLLPLTNALLSLVPAALGTLVLLLVRNAVTFPAVHLRGLALIVLASLLPGVVTTRSRRAHRAVRAAVIGPAGSAEMLARELAVAGVRDYQLVGAVSTGDGEGDHAATMPVLGGLANLGAIVEAHAIDLLLMGGDSPRLAVFDELANSCLHLPVRLWELSGFYEDVFGHVPVAEINASWFQYIMHPKYRTTGGSAKRLLDLVVAVPLAVLVGPLIGFLALLVKLDRGPAFFRQERIGEGGAPFTVVKLRTMRVTDEQEARWADANDPRVTRLGAVLRRTHLDELPQLVNVLRGDMSLVGPRPEQPQFVDRLERAIPFYTRRHLIKPGVTGWAQVRCGYSGSDTGSAWKLCHDLYYLKHRSMGLDLAILVETLRTLVADPQYDVEPAGVSFILRSAGVAEGDGTPLASL